MTAHAINRKIKCHTCTQVVDVPYIHPRAVDRFMRQQGWRIQNASPGFCFVCPNCQRERKTNIKVEYEIWCTIDIGKSVESVGEILRELNATMRECGLNEEITYQSKFSFGTITVNRELSKQELSDMRTLIGGELMKSDLFKKYGIRVESIRSKSSQPCSQPYNATNVTNAQ